MCKHSSNYIRVLFHTTHLVNARWDKCGYVGIECKGLREQVEAGLGVRPDVRGSSYAGC
jgi:hypothetical protein